MLRDEPLNKDSEVIADWIYDIRSDRDTDTMREIIHSNYGFYGLSLRTRYELWLADEAEKTPLIHLLEEIDWDHELTLEDVLLVYFVNQVEPDLFDTVAGEYWVNTRAEV